MNKADLIIALKVVRIRREVKGRKGKTITSIFGVSLEDQEPKQFRF